MHEGYTFRTEPHSPADGRRQGPTHHDPTDGVRQGDAGTAQFTGPSRPSDKPVPEGPPSDPSPREKIIRVEWEYVSVDTKAPSRVASFNNSTSLTDVLNDLMDIIMNKRCQSVETTLDSTYGVSGWVRPVAFDRILMHKSVVM